MNLTLKEAKKEIKNNQTVKLHIQYNSYTRELTSNKKYYKRYVKAVAQKVKSLCPALSSSQIVAELEQLEILPNSSCFDKDGYFVKGGSKDHVKNNTFIVRNNKIELSYLDRNDAYLLVDEELGMKLDNDVAVSDPFTNHFAILSNDPNRLLYITDKELPLFVKLSMKTNGTFNIAVDESIFAGTKSKMMSLDKQNFVRKEYAEEIKNIQNKIVEVNKVITPLYEELTTKFNDKVIKSQKVVSSKVVRASFNELSEKFHKEISKKLGLNLGYYSVALSYEIRWLGVESVLKHN